MVGILALTDLGAAAQENPPSAYEVQAACLFNFAKFTEWPATAFSKDSAPIVLAVLGKDPFGTVLDRTFAGQKIGARYFEIRRGGRLGDIGLCHILFVSESESGRLEAVFEALRNQNVLTVSDIERFAGAGGTFGFFTEEKKIRFEANPDAAQRAGLKVSSKLLNLARIVKGK
jgi:hypothetical protein